MEKCGRAIVIRRMPFACWITDATETYSESVIFIVFPRKQRLRERSFMLRYAYVAPVGFRMSVFFFPADIFYFIGNKWTRVHSPNNYINNFFLTFC